MLFRIDGDLYDLSRAADFLRLPMPMRQKLRFVALMARAYRKASWSDWEGRTARELVDAWGGTTVREQIFERLCWLKFELPSDRVSGAWLGARLHAREGSGKLGYIPGTNWTKRLCDGMVELAQDQGVRIQTGVAVKEVRTLGPRIHEVVLDNGEPLHADVFVSAMPTNVLARLLPGNPQFDNVRYTALLSVVCGTRQEIRDDFYWLNLLTPELTSSAIFMLTSLNPTIGHGGERCVNFVTHLRGPDRAVFRMSDAELLERYHSDYRSVFGVDLQLDWAHVSRIPAYSPVFVPEYQNPDIRCPGWENLYLTGNYRTYPSVASTGTALRAGVESGRAVVEECEWRARPARLIPGDRSTPTMDRREHTTAPV